MIDSILLLLPLAKVFHHLLECLLNMNGASKCSRWLNIMKCRLTIYTIRFCKWNIMDGWGVCGEREGGKEWPIQTMTLKDKQDNTSSKASLVVQLHCQTFCFPEDYTTMKLSLFFLIRLIEYKDIFFAVCRQLENRIVLF